MNVKKLILNCAFVGLVGIVVFFLHWATVYLFELGVRLNQLIYSYIINVLMANGVIILLFLLKKKLKDQLGFIFMAASMLKFVFFFILFYPQYNADGDLSKLEFLIFFIPYSVCLICECLILSRFLNGLDDLNG